MCPNIFIAQVPPMSGIENQNQNNKTIEREVTSFFLTLTDNCLASTLPITKKIPLPYVIWIIFSILNFEVKLHTLVPPWQATPLSLIDSYNTKQSYHHICDDGLSFGKTACLPVTGVLNDDKIISI